MSRSRANKLNSLVDDLKTPECQFVQHVLKACKSRKVKVWMETNNRITDALNEAKDNVKSVLRPSKSPSLPSPASRLHLRLPPSPAPTAPLPRSHLYPHPSLLRQVSVDARQVH